MLERVRMGVRMDSLLFIRFRVKEGTAPSKAQFIAIRSTDSTYAETELFLDYCRKRWPGGKVHYRGMFHGQLRYVSGDVEVRFCGIVRCPVADMEEAE